MAVHVLPGLVRRVLAIDEHRVGVPVVTLSWEVVASLEQQDALARRRQLPGERAAAGAAADDDDVVVLGHGQAPSVTREASGDGWASERCDAETMNPRCENACGKLPIIRLASVSYSSENMPTSFCRLRSRSNSSRASLLAADQREVVDEPERREQERALAGRKPVDGVLVGCRVALHEPVDHQLAFDRLDGADDPRIARWQETDSGEHQQARVELIGAVVLHEAVLLFVEPLVAHFGLDLVGDLLPPIGRHPLTARVLDDLHRSVERHPRHDLRLDEVALRTADLPDAVVW